MRAVLSLLLLISLADPAFAQGLSKQSAVRDSALPPIPMATFAASTAPAGTTVRIIPQNYYTQHLGFFCRQELKMQQAKVPISIRVGTMDQCNTLEQKPGYR